MKKKIILIVIFIIVFLGAVGGSFMYVKNLGKADNSGDKTSIKKNKVNEHIVETNRFATIGEWNSFQNGGIMEAFPDDSRYHMKKSAKSGAFYNVIDSEEVYKEYAKRLETILPEGVDFSKNFVVLVYNDDFKSFEEEGDLVIVDICENEDGGTMNIVLREREEPSPFACDTYNAWYAVINDRSLLRPATDVVIEVNENEE